MSEERRRSLNHFSLYHFKESYWGLPDEDRRKSLGSWLSQLRIASPMVEVYQVFPAGADADLLVWCATPIEDTETTAKLFTALAGAINPFRALIEPSKVLWGYTGPSAYSQARSAQEIDPFAPKRRAYLVVYPFVKTKEWYLLSQDARQGMMNEHIRLGKSYTEISQLLLYSFGLQDQEFVVVYEADDLVQFSDLVRELRSTDGRLYTERDTPIHTAIYHPAEETLSLWRAT
ncbi:MAG: chlorite dismutase family protein [Anaerolineales bacterium]